MTGYQGICRDGVYLGITFLVSTVLTSASTSVLTEGPNVDMSPRRRFDTTTFRRKRQRVNLDNVFVGPPFLNGSSPWIDPLCAAMPRRRRSDAVATPWQFSELGFLGANFSQPPFFVNRSIRRHVDRTAGFSKARFGSGDERMMWQTKMA